MKKRHLPVFPAPGHRLIISIIVVISSVILSLSVTADSDWGNPDNLPAPPEHALGYPSRAGDLDVVPGFRTPPAGYGEIPFWWWTGDPLDRERLLWQLDELKRKGVTGMQVNYAHEDTPGWPTYPNEPEIFSGEWWNIWAWIVGECRKRDMGIGLSGYTLDWPGKDNLFGRLLYRDLELNGIELALTQTQRVEAGQSVALKIPGEVIAARAYPLADDVAGSDSIDLAGLVKNGILTWRPVKHAWQVYVICAHTKPMTLNPLHPMAGQRVVERFFQPCEDNSPGGIPEGLNYFFQDELKFGVDGNLWAQDFGKEFRQRKGYDLLEVLPALFDDIGPVTPKVRLDYADVKVQLMEERYFKPIFDWHWQRGFIYGCDPGSRGLDPHEFGDYFRCVRWYTAPGHDTPGGKAHLIKGKVSSSIAHLYRRPRVWIEGYHSLGWGATPETLMKATCENYLYGCTLLNLHGLYYTTHGGFWEWAPPCYHFRMPYWEHMGVFLKYFERLSYLMSQGVHVCDVAVLYPVAPQQADIGGKEATETAFETARRLVASGIDFDFMDFQSLERTDIKDGRLHVSGESYRVLVLPAMRAIRWSAIRKALEFHRAGGIVIALGALPEASDRAGRNDPELDAAVRELFGVSSEESKTGAPARKQTNPNGGAGFQVHSPDEVSDEINRLVTPDFQAAEPGMAVHRKIGTRDVYMVMGAKKGTSCVFRAHGTVELWDPWTGGKQPLHVVSSTNEGTKVRMPLHDYEAQVIVFSPGEAAATIEATDLDEIGDITIDNDGIAITGYAAKGGHVTADIRLDGRLITLDGEASGAPVTLDLDGLWEFELTPTLDNRWGDFRLPVTSSTIGPEARIFSYSEEHTPAPGWQNPGYDDSRWERVTYGFGQKFWKLGPLPNDIDTGELDRRLSAVRQVDPAVPVEIGGKQYTWTPYAFSWRWGIEGDPGHQGYHGLKENITDDFICLGAEKDGLNETLYVQEESGTRYYLWTSAHAAEDGEANCIVGGLIPGAIYVNGMRVDNERGTVRLHAGGNHMVIRYDGPGRGHIVIERTGMSRPRERTALSMSWYDRPGVVPYDVRCDEPSPAGWYRFTAPPGLCAMTVPVRGTLIAWADGIPLRVERQNVLDNGAVQYHAILPQSMPGMAVVAFRIEQERGLYGGSVMPEPVVLDCGSGMIALGDWSKGSALECYSGGAWYRKNVTLTPEQGRGRIRLNLGEVAATAEVRVNGRSAGIRVAPPWTVDVTELVQSGENRIEILIFNTLANHYATIPTRYRGSPRSGLIGPVQIEISSPVKLVQGNGR